MKRRKYTIPWWIQETVCLFLSTELLLCLTTPVWHFRNFTMIITASGVLIRFWWSDQIFIWRGSFLYLINIDYIYQSLIWSGTFGHLNQPLLLLALCLLLLKPLRHTYKHLEKRKTISEFSKLSFDCSIQRSPEHVPHTIQFVQMFIHRNEDPYFNQISEETVHILQNI